MFLYICHGSAEPRNTSPTGYWSQCVLWTRGVTSGQGVCPLHSSLCAQAHFFRLDSEICTKAFFRKDWVLGTSDHCICVRASQVVLVVKNLPASAGELRDAASIPEDPLEEGMASRSSVLAWRIPWTEEPDRLQWMGSQRLGEDWSDLAWIACMHELGTEGNRIRKGERKSCLLV